MLLTSLNILLDLLPGTKEGWRQAGDLVLCMGGCIEKMKEKDLNRAKRCRGPPAPLLLSVEVSWEFGMRNSYSYRLRSPLKNESMI